MRCRREEPWEGSGVNRHTLRGEDYKRSVQHMIMIGDGEGDLTMAKGWGCVKSYSGNHGKSGKIGEDHSIFGWPPRLRHVRPIIPGEHRGYSC